MASVVAALATPLGSGVLCLCVAWFLPRQMEFVRSRIVAGGTASTPEFDAMIVKLRRLCRGLRHIGLASIVLGLALLAAGHA
jgi:hypothetical protein